MLTETMTQLPAGVDLLLEDITDVMVPHNSQEPGQVELRVNVSLVWANHGIKEHEIRQIGVEFAGRDFPSSIVASLARPLLAKPTGPGIFMRQENVPLVILLEEGSCPPGPITCESLREAGMDFQHRAQCSDPADSQAGGQIGLIPRLEALERDVQRRARAALTGDQLDQAERLLQTTGTHEEAMLRAAGTIAGTVLNRHLSDLIDRVNSTLDPREQYKRSLERDGLVRYANWLIAQGVVDPIERAGLEALAIVLSRCSRPSDERLTPPQIDEVEWLVREVRRYMAEIPLP